jgi:PPOX class probable F420-dependent enzyme
VFRGEDSPRLLDVSRPDDAHIDTRLRSEPIVWLATAAWEGTPHQAPVWFLWEDPTVVLFSAPGARKLANIVVNPLVSLALDTAGGGADVVILRGRAGFLGRDDAKGVVPAFVEKYSAMVPERALDHWFETFSEPVRVVATQVVAWTRSVDGLRYRTVGAPPGT